MKIGIIQSVIGAGGGNDTVLFALLEALKKTDHEVSLYSVSDPTVKLDYPRKKARKLIPIKLPIFGIYQKLTEPLLAKKARHEELVIALTGDLFLPSSKSQRMIFYSQNNYSDPSKQRTSKYSKGIWKYYYKPYQTMMKRMFKQIKDYNITFVANSVHVKKQLWEGINKDSKVIYPPVSLDQFYKAEKKKTIIIVARYSKEKNLEEAIKILSGIHCRKIIFGSMTAANRPYYKRLTKMPESKDIDFYVNENRNLMKKLLSESKVFLSTSDETFGIAIVEGMAAGCIPIVPNRTAHRETVPFDLLRTDGVADAKKKVSAALEGKYDFLLPSLQKHIQKFDKQNFQKQFLGLIER